MNLLVHCGYYMFRTYIYWLKISSILNEAEIQSSLYYNKRRMSVTFAVKIDTLQNTDIFWFYRFYRKLLRYGE